VSLSATYFLDLATSFFKVVIVDLIPSLHLSFELLAAYRYPVKHQKQKQSRCSTFEASFRASKGLLSNFFCRFIFLLIHQQLQVQRGKLSL
jgi:hypothetical protein